MPWLCPYIALFFILRSLATELNIGISATWYKEIKQSLQLNIHGKCNWTMASSINERLHKPLELLVSHHFPSKREVRSYQYLPTHFSKGNTKLLEVMNISRITNWAAETDLRWMIPEDHPGQDRHMCMNVTRALGNGEVGIFYEKFKFVERTMYLIKGRNGLINPDGQVMFGCGYYQGKEACETRWNHDGINLWNSCHRYMEKRSLTWTDTINQIVLPENVELFGNCTRRVSKNNQRAKAYKRVFVTTAFLDTNFHHLISDSLSRLPRFLDFLLRNPDVYVHIRKWEDFEPGYRRQDYEIATSRNTRRTMFQLLGINESRLIYGPVAAERVYIPRSMSCSHAARNAAEVRLLAKELIKGAEVVVAERRLNRNVTVIHQADDPAYNASRRNIVIIHRLTEGWGARTWSMAQYRSLEWSFRQAFPDYNIVHHSSDTLVRPNFCLACEIIEMTTADMLVGMHGAGLTKLMFMPPGGIVFEMSSHFNDAQMPVCGYYGNWAAIFGLHHYLYAYNFDNVEGIREPLNPVDVADKARAYFDFIREKSAFVTTISKPGSWPSEKFTDDN